MSDYQLQQTEQWELATQGNDPPRFPLPFKFHENSMREAKDRVENEVPTKALFANTVPDWGEKSKRYVR